MSEISSNARQSAANITNVAFTQAKFDGVCEQGSHGIVSPQQLHEAAIAMSKAVKEGKNEAETLEALVQSQQQVVAATASVEPRTAMRERNVKSRATQQVG